MGATLIEFWSGLFSGKTSATKMIRISLIFCSVDKLLKVDELYLLCNMLGLVGSLIIKSAFPYHQQNITLVREAIVEEEFCFYGHSHKQKKKLQPGGPLYF